MINEPNTLFCNNKKMFRGTLNEKHIFDESGACLHVNSYLVPRVFIFCFFLFFTQVSSMKQDSKKVDKQEKWDAEEEKERELVKTKAERERNWVGKLTSEWIGLAAGWIPEAHLSGQSLGPSVTGIPSEPSRESQTMRRRHTAPDPTFKELQKSGHLICPPTNIPGEGILWW